MPEIYYTFRASCAGSWQLRRHSASGNALSLRYGLALTETQIQALVNERFQSLVTAGRVEFGEGVLPRLIYAFCDSPYIQRNGVFSNLVCIAGFVLHF